MEFLSKSNQTTNSNAPPDQSRSIGVAREATEAEQGSSEWGENDHGSVPF